MPIYEIELKTVTRGIIFIQAEDEDDADDILTGLIDMEVVNIADDIYTEEYDETEFLGEIVNFDSECGPHPKRIYSREDIDDGM